MLELKQLMSKAAHVYIFIWIYVYEIDSQRLVIYSFEPNVKL